MTSQQKESDGSEASVTLTSDKMTREPCDDPRTKTVTFSLFASGMFLLACTGMFMHMPGSYNKGPNFGYTCVIRETKRLSDRLQEALTRDTNV